MTATRPRRHARTTSAVLAALLLATLAVVRVPTAAAQDTTTLTLLATNDIHRQLAPIDNPGGWNHGLGGLAYLAGHLDAARARVPGALYVDAGDMTGAGRSGVGVPGGVADEATVEAMNIMGLDAMTVGNHEFDAGVAEIRRNRGGGCYLSDCAYRHDHPYEGASFATLGANVLDETTGDTVFPPWTILETEGLRVGVVGITETSRIDPHGYGGLTTLDPFATANAAARDVKAAGADVVVLLLHVGSDQNPDGDVYDADGCDDPRGQSIWMLPWFDEAIDVVVDGHTHAAYVCDLEGMPLLTQASSRGTYFTEITLTYDHAASQIVERSATNHRVTPDVEPDPAVAAIVTGYKALVSTNAPSWADLDGDGLGDTYEVVHSLTDPRVADTDGDGVDDGDEVAAGTDPLTAPTSGKGKLSGGQGGPKT